MSNLLVTFSNCNRYNKQKLDKLLGTDFFNDKLLHINTPRRYGY